MADQQPSWLSTEDSGPPAAAGATELAAAAPAAEPAAASISVSDQSAPSASAAASSTVDESDLPKMIFVMRLANMGLAVVTISLFGEF